jgi:serine/threonine protein kinase
VFEATDLARCRKPVVVKTARFPEGYGKDKAEFYRDGVLHVQIGQPDCTELQQLWREHEVLTGPLEGCHGCPRVIVMGEGEDTVGRFVALAEEPLGTSLETYLEKHTRTERRPLLLRFGLQLMDILRYMHKRGIIHCDIKPGNLIVSEDGLRLIDFGGCVGCNEAGYLLTEPYAPDFLLEGKPARFEADYISSVYTLHALESGVTSWEQTPTELRPNIRMLPASGVARDVIRKSGDLRAWSAGSTALELCEDLLDLMHTARKQRSPFT